MPKLSKSGRFLGSIMSNLDKKALIDFTFPLVKDLLSKLATKAISNIKVNRYFIYHNIYSTNSYKNLPKHIRRYYYLLLLLLLFIFTIIIKTESVIINTLCISTYYFNGKI